MNFSLNTFPGDYRISSGTNAMHQQDTKAQREAGDRDTRWEMNRRFPSRDFVASFLVSLRLSRELQSLEKV